MGLLTSVAALLLILLRPEHIIPNGIRHIVSTKLEFLDHLLALASVQATSDVLVRSVKFHTFNVLLAIVFKSILLINNPV